MVLSALREVIVSLDEPTTCPSCDKDELEQDPDVLDTWFSSALWPFSTMGWPIETQELKTFYPTSVLVTAFDILFFWVARMMMMGLHFMHEAPFREVYVHALVRDNQGHKMSKSKGNVIDPLIMMDEYGTDALRFTLTALAVQGRDVKLAEERIEGYKHFINKIWNASRLVLMNLEGLKDLPELPSKPQKLMHRWILSRLQRVVSEAREALEGYHFNQYAHVLYQFVWHEYCDWYLEMIKPDFYGQDVTIKATAQAVATRLVEAILVLLHPVMPFVTEEIWQKLPHTTGSIMKAVYPAFDEQRVDAQAEEEMALIMEVINGIRNIRGEMNVPPASRVEVVCLVEGAVEKKLLQDHASTISDLSRLAELQIASAGEIEKPRIAASAVTHNVEVFVLLEDVLDFDSESKRLEKELAKMEKEFGFTQKKLSNEDFLKKAPAEVIESEREKGMRLREKLEKLRHQYEKIKILRQSATVRQ